MTTDEEAPVTEETAGLVKQPPDKIDCHVGWCRTNQVCFFLWGRGDKTVVHFIPFFELKNLLKPQKKGFNDI